MISGQPSIEDDVPTIYQVRAAKRQAQQVLTINLSDKSARPVVKFRGRWTNADMRAVDRAIHREYKVYRTRLRKKLVSNNGDGGR